MKVMREKSYQLQTPVFQKGKLVKEEVAEVRIRKIIQAAKRHTGRRKAIRQREHSERLTVLPSPLRGPSSVGSKRTSQS